MKKLIIATTLCATSAAMSATTINHYGFVKASYMMTNADLNTGWKPTSVNAGTTSNSDQREARSQFSATNSRWGMTASNGSKVTGRFEFDLDANEHNGASSLSNARVRQANMTYKVSQEAAITLGKKWSKFMGVTPFTYRYTTIALGAGNTGFLFDGVDYTRTMGATSFALELGNTNNGTQTDVQKASGPVITAMVDHKVGSHKFGLAHTMADIKYKELDDSKKDGKASGTKVFWSGKMGSTSAIAEYTMGSNLAAIQTGGIANSGNDDDHKETAYLLSLKHTMGDMSVFGSYGLSEYTKEEEAGNSNKSSNGVMSLGFDKVIDTGLTAFIEINTFTTNYYDSTDDESVDTSGSLTEIGMVYKF